MGFTNPPISQALTFNAFHDLARALAVINLKGTVDFFVNNTFNYPTLAEAYKIAGLDAWNRMGAV